MCREWVNYELVGRLSNLEDEAEGGVGQLHVIRDIMVEVLLYLGPR